MTASEWKIVIAAVSVFVIVNIIMWTLIIRSKKASATSDTSPSPDEFTESVKPPSKRKNKAPAPDPAEFRIPADCKPPEGFRLIDNVIIVHTDEHIDN